MDVMLLSPTDLSKPMCLYKEDIAEVTLLSKEEFEQCEDIIQKPAYWWWLRSPDAHLTCGAAIVNNFGYVDYEFVHNTAGRIRPVLRIPNLRYSNFKIGDRFGFIDNNVWTVISDELVLCDNSIGRTCFRENWGAPDANDYNVSSIKYWLEEWAVYKGLPVNTLRATSTFSSDEDMQNTLMDILTS